MRILLTGFGPFLGISDNPSMHIVEHFAAAPPCPGLTTRVLPVSFQRTAAIVPGLLRDDEPFDAALLLGVAATDPEMRLERFARNRRSTETPDADGFVPASTEILPGAADFYETQVPLDTLLSRLQGKGNPVRISEDAGAYVCNHAYYAALHTVSEAALQTRCLFVHVPRDAPAFPLARQIDAVESVLECLSGG
jgi:pyroglutamyl-peptidase